MVDYTRNKWSVERLNTALDDLQADQHYFCEWLEKEQLKAKEQQNYPRAKTLEQVINKVKESELWT